MKESPSNEKKKEVKTETEHIAAQTFSYKELAAATKNFKSDCLLGEGGFGRVYKGKLDNINQVCLWSIILCLFILITLVVINYHEMRTSYLNSILRSRFELLMAMMS